MVKNSSHIQFDPKQLKKKKEFKPQTSLGTPCWCQPSLICPMPGPPNCLSLAPTTYLCSPPIMAWLKTVSDVREAHILPPVPHYPTALSVFLPRATPTWDRAGGGACGPLLYPDSRLAPELCRRDRYGDTAAPGTVARKWAWGLGPPHPEPGCRCHPATHRCICHLSH